jgi:hypothetical protein
VHTIQRAAILMSALVFAAAASAADQPYAGLQTRSIKALSAGSPRAGGTTLVE